MDALGKIQPPSLGPHSLMPSITGSESNKSVLLLHSSVSLGPLSLYALQYAADRQLSLSVFVLMQRALEAVDKMPVTEAPS